MDGLEKAAVGSMAARNATQGNCPLALSRRRNGRRHVLRRVLRVIRRTLWRV